MMNFYESAGILDELSSSMSSHQRSGHIKGERARQSGGAVGERKQDKSFALCLYAQTLIKRAFMAAAAPTCLFTWVL